MFVVNPAVPADTRREFIALVKADPKKYSFATSGLGSAGHLSEETIKRQAGIPDLLIVPYKGAGPATIDLVGGHVNVMFATAAVGFCPLYKPFGISTCPVKAR